MESFANQQIIGKQFKDLQVLYKYKSTNSIQDIIQKKQYKIKFTKNRSVQGIYAQQTQNVTKVSQIQTQDSVNTYKHISSVVNGQTNFSDFDLAKQKMKDINITVFSSQQYVLDFLEEPMQGFCPNVKYIATPLDATSAKLAEGSQIVNIFVNDICDSEAVKVLAKVGVKFVTLRCAGYDRVDLVECQKYGIKVVRVPAYSPQSVAEHAVTLMISLSRNIHLAYNRVAFNNFSLSGLVGNEIGRRTVGIYGTGSIGIHTAKILKHGFGCKVIGYNHRPKQAAIDIGIEYVTEDELFEQSDILSLHCPLKKELYNLVNKHRFQQMKDDSMLINVSRGGLIDTDALIECLQSGKLRGAGLDVYKHEHELFFEDRSQYSYKEIGRHWDNKFAILRSYPNVIITPHSAFLTSEALANIAKTTIDNITEWVLDKQLSNQVYHDVTSMSERCGPESSVCEIPL